MDTTVNLLCTRERLGQTVTELRANNVPEGQIVGETFAMPDGCVAASGWEAFSYQFSALGAELWMETKNVFTGAIGALPAIFFYVGIILACMFIYRTIKSKLTPTRDYTSLKTVTFGDESAVRSDLPASILSLILIFVIWGSFTGSSLIPGFLHLPGPYTGETSFTYTAQDANGNTADAEVFVRVIAADATESEMVFDEGEGSAKNDGVEIVVYRSENIAWDRNDDVTRRDDGARIVAINGEEFDFAFGTDDAGPAPSFDLDFARVAITERGTINVVPDQGWQMQPLYLPAPEVVWNRFIEIAKYSCLVLRWVSRWVTPWAYPTGSEAGLTPSWNSCAPCHHSP